MYTPLLKNLSWSFRPTIMRAPLPASTFLALCAALHWLRHSRSTVSSAGFRPLSTSSRVKRLSWPLCSSMIHNDGFAEGTMRIKREYYRKGNVRWVNVINGLSAGNDCAIRGWPDVGYRKAGKQRHVIYFGYLKILCGGVMIWRNSERNGRRIELDWLSTPRVQNLEVEGNSGYTFCNCISNCYTSWSK